MSYIPSVGIYRIKHVSTNTYLTRSTSSLIGSPTAPGMESQWRLSTVPGVQGGFFVSSRQEDRYLGFDGLNNMIMSDTAVWFIEYAGVTGQYFLHAHWNGYVAIIDPGNKAAKLRRAYRDPGEKWIFEFVAPLDKPATGRALHQLVHYPFAPGNYIIRNVKTGTVMDLAGTAVVGNKANGRSSQRWTLRPTATGTAMGITMPTGEMSGVPNFKADTGVEAAKSGYRNYMLLLTRADKGFWISPLGYPFHVYDLAAANPADGAKIVLWPMTGEDHQKWYFQNA